MLGRNQLSKCPILIPGQGQVTKVTKAIQNVYISGVAYTLKCDTDGRFTFQTQFSESGVNVTSGHVKFGN